MCCERCGGQTIEDVDGEYSCLQCGFVKYTNKSDIVVKITTNYAQPRRRRRNGQNESGPN